MLLHVFDGLERQAVEVDCTLVPNDPIGKVVFYSLNEPIQMKIGQHYSMCLIKFNNLI